MFSDQSLNLLYKYIVVYTLVASSTKFNLPLEDLLLAFLYQVNKHLR